MSRAIEQIEDKEAYRLFFGEIEDYAESSKDNYYEAWKVLEEAFSGDIADITVENMKKVFKHIKTQDWTLGSKKLRWSLIKNIVHYLIGISGDRDKKVDFYFYFNTPTNFKWANNGHKRKKTITMDDIYTFEELEKLLSHLKYNNSTKYLMVRILIETGMRKGELRNIDLERNGEKLEDALRQNIIPTIGKTNYKEYPITEDLAQRLLVFLEGRKTIETESKALFLSQKGKKRIDGHFTYINIFLKKTLEDLKIERRASPHLFRHTINTYRQKLMIEKTGSFEKSLIEYLVGHKQTQTSNDKYSHLGRTDKVALYNEWNPYKELNF